MKITFQPSGKTIEIDEDISILNAAIQADVTRVFCCGITPACGICKVTIIDGEENISLSDTFEAEQISSQVFLPGERFGCMAIVHGDVEIEVHE